MPLSRIPWEGRRSSQVGGSESEEQWNRAGCFQGRRRHIAPGVPCACSSPGTLYAPCAPYGPCALCAPCGPCGLCGPCGACASACPGAPCASRMPRAYPTEVPGHCCAGHDAPHGVGHQNDPPGSCGILSSFSGVRCLSGIWLGVQAQNLHRA